MLRSMRRLGLLALGLLAACAATPRGPRAAEARAHAPRVSVIDVEHYALDLALDPVRRRMSGSCAVRLWTRIDGVERVELDLVGLDVAGVLDEDGKPLEWSHADGVLAVELGRSVDVGDFVELDITYGGSPLRGLWFADPEDGVPTQVFTQGECEDARYWFPCWDVPSDRATSELRVTLPPGWTSVAAGERVDRMERADGRVVEHWRMSTPHPTYLLTLVAGELETVAGEWEGVPLSYLVEDEWVGAVETAFASTAGALEFLSELTGMRYPYAKYSQACVENFPFGGMENISATTMTETMLTDERGYRDYDPTGLVVHEAAHQWFGDLLTCRDWSHIWLNEGFATYLTLLYFEATRGEEEFRARMRDAQESYLEGDVGADRRPIVHDEYIEPMDLFFGGHTYPGGASRLHLLRLVLGEEAFFRGLRVYVAENRGRGVVTADFQRAMEVASGVDLSSFFEQWLYSPGFPEFEWSWRWDGLHVFVTVRQVQSAANETPPVFRAPALIEVRTDAGSTVHRVSIQRREHQFQIPAAGEPLWVHFDRGGWIPKTEQVERGLDEWLAIASLDTDVNARRDAVDVLATELGGNADLDARRHLVLALIERLVEDSSRFVRRAAASGLAGVTISSASDALASAARQDPAADVRVAALDALASIGQDAELARFAREVFDEGYSWASMGAAARLLRAAAPTEGREFLLEQLATESPHDVLRASLLTTVGSYADDETVRVLHAWAMDEAASTAARRAAIEQLGRLRPEDGSIRRDLIDLLARVRTLQLQTALIEALGNLGDRRALPALEAHHARCHDARQHRAIETILRRPWAR
jgi:aminopeptidase N